MQRRTSADLCAGVAGWLIAGVAFLPMALVYTLHFLLPMAGTRGSGFLQYDQPMYMAAALKHFEGGFFPTYGLPYSADYAIPKLNVQLSLLFLGGVTQLTGWDPGHVYAGFGVIAGIVMLWVAIRLLREFAGPLHGVAGLLVILLFLWGGGILTLSGIGAGLVKGLRLSYWDMRDVAFQFDPGDGNWFLNLGRNLYYPLEAFYHAIFFGAVICLRQRRYAVAFAMLLLTMAIHPFTAIELSVVLGGIAALEWSLRADPPPIWLLIGIGVALPIYILQGLLLIPRLSSEQAALTAQHAVNWPITWHAMVPAYLPVGLIVAWRFWRAPSWRELLAQRDVRMLLVWFVGCFALINHDLVVKGHQPIHFTRGYDWTPLALLAAPVVYGWLQRPKRWFIRATLVPAFLAVALFDNASWFGRFYIEAALGRSLTFMIPSDMDAVFQRLRKPDLSQGVVVSNDASLRYLAVTYSPLRSWASHPHATPFYDRRLAEMERFLAEGTEPSDWSGRRIVAINRRDQDPAWGGDEAPNALYRRLDRIGRYDILVREPMIPVR